MNLQQIEARIAELDARYTELKSELDFLNECRDDFSFREYMAESGALLKEMRAVSSEKFALSGEASEIRLENDLQTAVDNFCGAVEQAADYVESEFAIEAETVEVVAEPVTETNDDDWLLEEFEAICDDPAGERFKRPQPVFQSFIHYVMFVLGILGKSVSNYLSWQGYGINTNTVIA